MRPVRGLPRASPPMPSACTLTGAQLGPAWATQKRPRPPRGLGSVVTVIGSLSPTRTRTWLTLRPARPNANDPIPGGASVWSVTAPLPSLPRPQRRGPAGAGPAQSGSTPIPTQCRPELGALTYSPQRAILVAPLAIVTAPSAACAGGNPDHPVNTAVASTATIQRARRMSRPRIVPLPGPRRKRGQAPGRVS